MEELYIDNFKWEFSPVSFQKVVHPETKLWSVIAVERANMTIEVDEKALKVIEHTRRVCIKWYSYRCRPLAYTSACHRCFRFTIRGPIARSRRPFAATANKLAIV